MISVLKKPLFLIFILALFLRLFRLGEFPYGFHIDEVKVGWNALSILTTGKDDHGNFLAGHYNSFGDWRPTGIFYLTTLPILIFGNNEFAVRFASAFFGALTIFPIYLLTNSFFKKTKVGNWSLAIGNFASFLLAISPWHLATSRATSEIVISTFFALFGIYFFLKLQETKKNIYSSSTVLSFLISFSLYHSIRILAPLYLFVILVYKKSKLFIPLILVGFVSLLLTLSPEARQRLNQVSLFKHQDTEYQLTRVGSKAVVYTREFVNEYLSYFSTEFLTGNGAKPYRYATPGFGLLTYIELFLFFVGILVIFKNKAPVLPIIFLLISPLTAALTHEDSPNLHRAFLMLPWILIIEAYGFTYLSKFKKLYFFTFVFLALNFLFYYHSYFKYAINHKPFIKELILDSSSYRNVGAKELALKIEKIQNDYDKIIITNFPDNLYPWYTFFTNKNPLDFNKLILWNTNEIIYKNIVFSDIKCPSDDSFTNYKQKRILVIDNWECASEVKIKDGLQIKIVDKILRPDGSLVYTLLERN